MQQDLRLQRLFDRVELVNGVGSRSAGQMCVMSFVACLAGEKETDAPRCASPVIRTFAILINDQMPGDLRQRLKPFAPCIAGTNDGLDEARAEILRRALAEEILPRESRFRVSATARAGCAGLFAYLWSHMLHHRIDYLLNQGESRRRRPDYAVQMASAAGALLGFCARNARNADETEWYWSTAIGLLDRLCEVGLPERQRALGPRADNLAWLAERDVQRG
jgi:hypothetical protein